MKKWMRYMQDKYMRNDIITKDSYGDWCVPPESPELIHSKDSSRNTDPALLATATYFHMLQLMQQFAALAGKQNDVKDFAMLSVKVKDAFNKRFFNAATKQYSNNTVTANILPLAFNMVPGNNNEGVFRNIVDKTMNENKGHISTGVIGTQWLMRWLTLHGRTDIAYQLATNRDYPGWGYMAANGATTIWELWNGNTADPKMNSQNHVMLLGDLIIWFYENLAGIKTDPQQPAFKAIEMKPSFVDGPDHVKSSYHSMYGLIRSEWNKTDKMLEWKISVPANTKAMVYLPAGSVNDIRESSSDLASANCVRFLRMAGDRALVEIGSGDYKFRVSR
jgi:alpha-L-rhamnosidase